MIFRICYLFEKTKKNMKKSHKEIHEEEKPNCRRAYTVHSNENGTLAFTNWSFLDAERVSSPSPP